PKIVSISPEQTVLEAHTLMRQHGFRKMVVTIEGYLSGIITQTDLVTYAAKTMTRFAATKDGVEHWMTKRPILIGPNVSFSEARRLMVKRDIGAIIVKGKEYEGIFTEYDVVAQFYDQGGMLQIKSPKEIMHPHIRSIKLSHSIPLANRIMLEKNVRRLLVIDGDKVVGIITQTDVADAFVEMAKELSNDSFLEKQKFFEKPTKEMIDVTFVKGNLKVYHLVKK
ncbi:CBS domain-containing protein, partial [Candidatus Woesearchaeota archaeon]|nr:CBS domain-containing protein [Candidatus Woesearchaeota archaeon]